MKRFLLPAAYALTIALFGACVQDPPPRRPAKRPPGWHPPVENTQETTGETSNEEPPTHTDTKPPTTENKPPPAVPEKPVSVGEIKYAKPVPGKTGFVFSPYDENKGYIDVRGFPPGTEVKDPYSGKSFLVP